MVVFVKGDSRVGADQPEQIREEPSVVGLVEIAVAQHEGVGKDDDDPRTQLLYVAQRIAATAAQDRDLRRGREEGDGEAAARHGGHPLEDRVCIFGLAGHEPAVAGD